MVIDTNVVVSALKSKIGASNKLLSLVGTNKFEINVSVPLILEYEAILKRGFKNLSARDIEDLLDYMCAVGKHIKIHYLWRPTLKDASDELILELAVAAGANFIVTYNLKDFVGSNRFGIEVITPKEFLVKLGEIK